MLVNNGSVFGRIGAVLSLIVYLIALSFSFTRLFYGVDLMDEAFYSLLPYQFIALHQTPFIDELNILQLSGFLLYPFIKLYVFLYGTEGIILFNRYLFFIFFLLVQFIAFITIRRKLPWPIALLISTICCLFMPYNIPSLSYNTMGMGFFTLGLFVNYAALNKKKSKGGSLFSGILLGLAVIAYPTLIIPVLLLILISLVYKREAVKSLLLLITGGIISAVPIISIIYYYGVAHFFTGYAYTKSFDAQGGSFFKIFNEIGKFYNSLPSKEIIAVTGILLLLTSLRKERLFQIITLIIIVFIPSVFFLEMKITIATMKIIIFYSLLAPFVLRKELKPLFYFVWMPSFMAGVTGLWTSSNGYMAASIGLLPASIVSLVMVCHTIHHYEGTLQGFIRKLTAVSPVILICLLLLFQRGSVYGDDMISDLKFRVDTGPYAGLYTSEAKLTFIHTLEKDLAAYLKQFDTVLYFDMFPAGYFFSLNRPGINTIWLFNLKYFPKTDRDYNHKYYDNNPTPDVVFKMKEILVNKHTGMQLEYHADDPLNQLINSSQYRELYSNNYYTIYRKL